MITLSLLVASPLRLRNCTVLTSSITQSLYFQYCRCAIASRIALSYQDSLLSYQFYLGRQLGVRGLPDSLRVDLGSLAPPDQVRRNPERSTNGVKIKNSASALRRHLWTETNGTGAKAVVPKKKVLAQSTPSSPIWKERKFKSLSSR